MAGSGGGGAGATGSLTSGNGAAATALGGGGAGASSSSTTLRTGGAGAAGKVQITYTGADYRSKQTGNWNDTTTWQTYDGSSWVAASATPNANNNVYIQSVHTVTLQQNEACSDLHIATGTTGTSSSLLGKIALQTYTLALYGKLRCYYAAVGTTPGTSSWDGYSMYPCTASAGGKISVAGNSRALTVSGQWSASITTTATGAFPLEINLTPGQTATLATSIKCASLVVNAGTLDAGNNGIAADTGTAGRGDVTINSSGVLRSAMSGTNAGNQVMSQSTMTRAGILTVNSGGRLLLTGNPPCIDMDSIVFSGAVEYNKANVQTLTMSSGRDVAAANPSAYTDLILSGTSQKTLGLNTTVNGTLIMAGTDATVTLFLGTSTLTYGASSTLAYAAGAAQTTANTEFPASGGPISLTISNANGVTLLAGQSRTINGTVTMAQGVLTLGSGASLAYGSAGTLVYAGSTAQTTSAAEFPSSSGPFNLAINNVSGVTLLAGQSRTINGTVTMAQGSLTLGSGASLAYGSAGTLVYAGSIAQTTSAAEFPSSSGPFNLRINNASGVTLAFSRTISGTLTLLPGAGLDLNSQSIICGSASLAGTLTMEINKTGPGTYTGSKLTQTAGTLTYGGVLTVNNIGLALQGGEVFDLFDAPTFNTGSSFSAVTLPSPLASGLNWYTGNLAVDGTIIVNRAPVGGAHAITTRTNLPITVSANKLKAGDSDPDTNQLSITAVSDPQPSGASVSLTSGVITYNPGSAAAGGGSFKYTLEDDRGGSTLVTVTVTITDSSSGGGSPNLVYGPVIDGTDFVARFAGIPGQSYTIESSTSATGPWVKKSNVTVPTDNSLGFGVGVFEVRQATSESNSGFYRTVYPAY
ncbi:MAG: cadherin-like domain-containing protein [Verrucomicrobiota bacterium]